MPETILFVGDLVLFDGDLVACRCCCPTDLPALTHDTVGKSLTKCGYPQNTGPERRFLTKTVTHSYSLHYTIQAFGAHAPAPSCCETVVSETTWTAGGTKVDTVDPESCDTTAGETPEDGTVERLDTRTVTNGPLCGATTCGGLSESFPSSDTVPWDYAYTGSPIGGVSWDAPVFDTPTATTTGYSLTLDYSGTEPAGGDTACGCPTGGRILDFEGLLTHTEELSDEYTDEDLVTAVQAAITAEGYDADYNDTAGAYRNRSEDGLTYEERTYAPGQGPRWPLPAGLINGTAYRLRYLIRFEDLDDATEDGDETYHGFTFATGQTYVDLPHVDLPEENGTNYLIVLGLLCGPFAP